MYTTCLLGSQLLVEGVVDVITYYYMHVDMLINKANLKYKILFIPRTRSVCHRCETVEPYFEEESGGGDSNWVCEAAGEPPALLLAPPPTLTGTVPVSISTGCVKVVR